MTSIFRSFLAASAVFATFAAVQPSLHAQGFGGAFSSFFSDGSDDEDNIPVDVSASIADIYLEKNIITLLGNVIVDRKDTKITCNKMEIFLKDKAEETADADREKTEKPKEKKPEVKPAAVPAGDSADRKDTDEKEDKDDDGMNQNISKLVCTGDVVYREHKQDSKLDEDSLALAAKGDYDETTGIIVMTGGHTNPKEELPEVMYNDIVRVVGKDMVKEYPVMKQGSAWILGDRIEIFVKDRNHMRVINPKVSSNKGLSTDTNSGTSTRKTTPGSTR